MNISNVIAKGQLVPLTFMQDAVAASQSDVQLKIAEVASAAANDVDEICIPWSGEIVGISFDLTPAGSAGTLTVGATINGIEDADTTQTITTAVRGSAKVKRGSAQFAAGDYIGVEITSDGSWNGTTTDLLVTVWVLVNLAGI